MSEQVGGDEGATSGAPALSSHSPASSFPLGHHQPRCHTCHVQADCEGCRGGGRGGDGPGQMGPRSKNINIHPPCPPGYSVAVGEFSGDDTEGECVPRLRPRERVDGDPGTETLNHSCDSLFPTLSPQLSLLFADFVAGVPKGNLTYGYVRPCLTPLFLPSPTPRPRLLADDKKTCALDGLAQCREAPY